MGHNRAHVAFTIASHSESAPPPPLPDASVQSSWSTQIDAPELARTSESRVSSGNPMRCESVQESSPASPEPRDSSNRHASSAWASLSHFMRRVIDTLFPGTRAPQPEEPSPSQTESSEPSQETPGSARPTIERRHSEPSSNTEPHEEAGPETEQHNYVRPPRTLLDDDIPMFMSPREFFERLMHTSSRTAAQRARADAQGTQDRSPQPARDESFSTEEPLDADHLNGSAVPSSHGPSAPVSQEIWLGVMATAPMPDLPGTAANDLPLFPPDPREIFRAAGSEQVVAPSQDTGSHAAAAQPATEHPTTTHSAARDTTSESSAARPSSAEEDPSLSGQNRSARDTSATHDAPERPGRGLPPHFLIYIPRSNSPLPFSMLYDAQVGIAWPLIERTPPGTSIDIGAAFHEAFNNINMGIESNQEQPAFHILGIPFHVSFMAPPREDPDPEKAAAFVDKLETVDHELRMRMARFGLSNINVYGVLDDEALDGSSVVGCGICLEPYATEDRPLWFTGKEQGEMERVVAVPCSGYHTVHAACLRSWLSHKPPSKWSCPFCRAPLGAAAQQCASNSRSAAEEASPDSHEEAPPMSLREYVHERERKARWRCDAPACLPCYGDNGRFSRMVQMMPCHHQIHLDCLCTSMSVECCNSRANGTNDENEGYYDDIVDADDDDEESLRGSRSLDWSSMESSVHSDPGVSTERDTIGKWVTCAACRKDAWAEVPTRRRPRRTLAHSMSRSVQL